ncbi:hypothetical protein NM688_g5702 [Phlebia brevispora]|uniref:Uncharacterized protein n=1 Tax=Phlebia brevispora TaxID=194682 RepID=A0ACC1SR91_9APHY|nr:hypothetical protein NM688_g5702 [Phlebia brevispora]
MDDPAKEIAQVVNLVTAAVNPDIQKAAVLKYYTPDATFRHPLCTVAGGPGSRDIILGILQWYRVMSPHLKIEVRGVTYNASKNELFVEVVQEFHIRWNPFPVAPARLMVHLVLRPSDDDPRLYQIALHEDFYQPTDIAALMVPPLIPIVKLLQQFGTVASVINARVFGLFGFWSTSTDKGKAVDAAAQTQGTTDNSHANGDGTKYKTD